MELRAWAVCPLSRRNASTAGWARKGGSKALCRQPPTFPMLNSTLDEEAGEIVRGIFAPFSHDAEIVNSGASSRTAAVVAEPGSLLVFALGAFAILLSRHIPPTGIGARAGRAAFRKPVTESRKRDRLPHLLLVSTKAPSWE